VNLEEYSSFDASGLADLVRDGQVEPSELVRCALDGVAAVNPTIAAVVEPYTDRLLDSAGDGHRGGAFAGVPTMVKDLFHGEIGRNCGNGSRLGEGWKVGSESGFARLVRQAGLITVGRTTSSEFGLLGTTETLAQGRTCSPWSADHMAGGSSGGAASVVGAGVVPVATASDGGGSIRIPAAACGVVGLKPGRGRITWGPQAGEPLCAWAVHFFVTRSVRDVAGLLDSFAGEHPGDPFVIPPPARPYRCEIGAPVERLRIATWSLPLSGDQSDPQVVAATGSTAKVLEGLGHDVTEERPPVDWEVFLTTMTDVWAADLAHTIDGFAALVGRRADARTLEGPTLATVEYGRRVTAVQLIEASDQVNLIARRMGDYFGRYDVLLTPTLGALPARLGVYDPKSPTSPRDTFSGWAALESFLPLFNATGQPAISIPLHQSDEGLPIGMHLVGRPGAESLLLRLSSQLEEALPWHRRRPPIHVSSPPDGRRN
jgi:amidase